MTGSNFGAVMAFWCLGRCFTFKWWRTVVVKHDHADHSPLPVWPADSVKLSGGRVLVHCQAGISRSATICLAYLMHTQRVKLQEAFDFVKQRRKVISPNLAFMGQLLQFETDVLCQGWSSNSPSGCWHRVATNESWTFQKRRLCVFRQMLPALLGVPISCTKSNVIVM